MALEASPLSPWGNTPEEWRRSTSHDITFSNCIIAEGLSKSTHGKGEHSKGSLLHDNATHVLIRDNLYASNMDRNLLAKGGVQAVIVNNWISNPGGKGIANALVASEWGSHTPQTSRLTIVGNLLEHGPDTSKKLALFENLRNSPVEVFMDDNLAFDAEGKPGLLIRGDAIQRLTSPPDWAGASKLLPASKIKERIARNVGARPWDRDEIDQRIILAALEGKGHIISSEQEVGGYPDVKPRGAPFKPEEWTLETMERR